MAEKQAIGPNQALALRSQEIWDERIEQAAHTIVSMWDETADEANADGDYHGVMHAMLDTILRGMVFDAVACPAEFKQESDLGSVDSSRLPSCEACGKKATHISMLDSVQYECFCDEHKPDGASSLECDWP